VYGQRSNEFVRLDDGVEERAASSKVGHSSLR
jgi:hypothetical protein